MTLKSSFNQEDFVHFTNWSLQKIYPLKSMSIKKDNYYVIVCELLLFNLEM